MHVSPRPKKNLFWIYHLLQLRLEVKKIQFKKILHIII